MISMKLVIPQAAAKLERLSDRVAYEAVIAIRQI